MLWLAIYKDVGHDAIAGRLQELFLRVEAQEIGKSNKIRINIDLHVLQHTHLLMDNPCAVH